MAPSARTAHQRQPGPPDLAELKLEYTDDDGLRQQLGVGKCPRWKSGPKRCLHAMEVIAWRVESRPCHTSLRCRGRSSEQLTRVQADAARCAVGPHLHGDGRNFARSAETTALRASRPRRPRESVNNQPAPKAQRLRKAHVVRQRALANGRELILEALLTKRDPLRRRRRRCGSSRRRGHGARGASVPGHDRDADVDSRRRCRLVPAVGSFVGPNVAEPALIGPARDQARGRRIAVICRERAIRRLAATLLHTREVAGSKPAAPIASEPALRRGFLVSGPVRPRPPAPVWKRYGNSGAAVGRRLSLVEPRSAGSCLPSYPAHQRSRPGAVKVSPSGPSAARREAVALTVAGRRS